MASLAVKGLTAVSNLKVSQAATFKLNLLKIDQAYDNKLCPLNPVHLPNNPTITRRWSRICTHRGME